MSIVSFARAQRHFPTFDNVQWLSLSLESQYLRIHRNSGTIEGNFHFRAGHGTDAPNPGLSRKFRDGWQLRCKSYKDLHQSYNQRMEAL